MCTVLDLVGFCHKMTLLFHVSRTPMCDLTRDSRLRSNNGQLYLTDPRHMQLPSLPIMVHGSMVS